MTSNLKIKNQDNVSDYEDFPLYQDEYVENDYGDDDQNYEAHSQNSNIDEFYDAICKYLYIKNLLFKRYSNPHLYS